MKAVALAAALSLVDQALAPKPAFLQTAATLRQAVLEHTGPRHREAARRQLVWLLLLRQEGPIARGGAFQQAIEHPELCTADTAPPFTGPCGAPAGQLAALYGQGGNPRAAAALAEHLRAAAPAERLVAANSLALTGIVPEAALVARVVAAAGAERDPAVRLEDMLVLAAFAERSKDALKRFRQLLLAEDDCGLVEATVLNLPSHDLRLVLYKQLTGGGARAAQIRRWVRAQPAWEPCR